MSAPPAHIVFGVHAIEYAPDQPRRRLSARPCTEKIDPRPKRSRGDLGPRADKQRDLQLNSGQSSDLARGRGHDRHRRRADNCKMAHHTPAPDQPRRMPCRGRRRGRAGRAERAAALRTLNVPASAAVSGLGRGECASNRRRSLAASLVARMV